MIAVELPAAVRGASFDTARVKVRGAENKRTGRVGKTAWAGLQSGRFKEARVGTDRTTLTGARTRALGIAGEASEK